MRCLQQARKYSQKRTRCNRLLTNILPRAKTTNRSLILFKRHHALPDAVCGLRRVFYLLFQYHVLTAKSFFHNFANERNQKIMTQQKVNLTMPRSWNECSTEQLELISRIMLEQIERSDRYHPFDMRNVKIAFFFVLSGIE